MVAYGLAPGEMGSLRETFENIDQDNSGTISLAEMAQALEVRRNTFGERRNTFREPDICFVLKHRRNPKYLGALALFTSI